LPTLHVILSQDIAYSRLVFLKQKVNSHCSAKFKILAIMHIATHKSPIYKSET